MEYALNSGTIVLGATGIHEPAAAAGIVEAGVAAIVEDWDKTAEILNKSNIVCYELKEEGIVTPPLSVATRGSKQRHLCGTYSCTSERHLLMIFEMV